MAQLILKAPWAETLHNLGVMKLYSSQPPHICCDVSAGQTPLVTAGYLSNDSNVQQKQLPVEQQWV